MKTILKKRGTYTQVGDYILPNLSLPAKGEKNEYATILKMICTLLRICIFLITVMSKKSLTDFFYYYVYSDEKSYSIL